MEVLEQHNFHNKKQIELLQVLSYALHKKHYPHDTCGIIDRKIKLLEQAELEAPEKESHNDNTEKSGTKRTQKVTADVVMLLLQKSGISATSDDKAKMARLIAYLTGFSEEKIRQRLSNTDELTSYHRDEIETVNKILAELNCDISIKYNKQR